MNPCILYYIAFEYLYSASHITEALFIASWNVGLSQASVPVERKISFRDKCVFNVHSKNNYVSAQRIKIR